MSKRNAKGQFVSSKQVVNDLDVDLSGLENSICAHLQEHEKEDSRRDSELSKSIVDTLRLLQKALQVVAERHKEFRNDINDLRSMLENNQRPCCCTETASAKGHKRTRQVWIYGLS